MPRLTFKTPSRNCPAKAFNGHAVEVLAVKGRRRVMRAGGRMLSTYTVTNGGYAWTALQDELFIEAA